MAAAAAAAATAAAAEASAALPPPPPLQQQQQPTWRITIKIKKSRKKKVVKCYPTTSVNAFGVAVVAAALAVHIQRNSYMGC